MYFLYNDKQVCNYYYLKGISFDKEDEDNDNVTTQRLNWETVSVKVVGAKLMYSIIKISI